MTTAEKIALWSVVGSTLVALAGVVTAILAPLLAERARRKSTREELLMTHRVDIYVQMLNLGGERRRDALALVENPDANPLTHDFDIGAIFARARALSSAAILAEFRSVVGSADAIVMLQVAYQAGNVPPAEDGSARTAYVRQASAKNDELQQAWEQMHGLIRREMGADPAPRQSRP